MATIRTVLFDLDGTLADTAPDLAFALNSVLQEQGKAMLSFDTIRPHVSHGGPALIKLGFGLSPDETGFAPLRERMLEIYLANLTRETRLFPGMAQLLDWLESRGMAWGVVTNKPGWLTHPLMEQLNLAHRAVSIVAGDTVPNRKPHPEPMLLACEHSGCSSAECLYVGDAERDIEAGRNAGMHTLVAAYGYLGPQDHPETWGADAIIDSPQGIIDWLLAGNCEDTQA